MSWFTYYSPLPRAEPAPWLTFMAYWGLEDFFFFNRPLIFSLSLFFFFSVAQRHVLTYVEDAVCQLLENKEDISQYGIARFFTE